MSDVPVYNQDKLCSEITYSTSEVDQNTLCEVIKESLLGTCGAIFIDNELIYNNYDKSRTPTQIIQQDMFRDHFSKNLKLFIQPNNDLNIKIHMFYQDKWLVELTYSDNMYILRIYK
jgi:hypothetical protein